MNVLNEFNGQPEKPNDQVKWAAAHDLPSETVETAAPLERLVGQGTEETRQEMSYTHFFGNPTGMAQYLRSQNTPERQPKRINEPNGLDRKLKIMGIVQEAITKHAERYKQLAGHQFSVDFMPDFESFGYDSFFGVIQGRNDDVPTPKLDVRLTTKTDIGKQNFALSEDEFEPLETAINSYLRFLFS